MSEKRKEHRLRANIPVRISCGREKDLSGRTDNISRLGAFVELGQEIPTGQSIRITLEMPAYTQDDSLLGDASCMGTVFRSSLLRETGSERVYGTGIFFTDFATPGDKDKISAYVDYLIELEQQGIKEGLKRRKEKDVAHRKTRQDQSSAARQAEFQKETLALLHQISSRLDDLARLLDERKR